MSKELQDKQPTGKSASARHRWQHAVRSRPWLGKLLATGLGCFMVLILVLMLEGAAVALRSAKGLYTYPFLVCQNRPRDLRAASGGYRHLDPQLGYAAAEPFETFGDPSDPRAYRILTLGGSTADTRYDANNWPGQLYDRLRASGQPVVLFNGGIVGYTTSQELFKLLRDGLLLQPDLVISVNGINDWGAFLVEDHPMVNTYQHYLLQQLTGETGPNPPTLLPNLITRPQ